MNVDSMMTRDPKTCTTADTLHRAANLMWETDCGSIPVVDANGRLRGMLTDRDLCMASYTQGRALHEIGVETVMSKMLFTLAPKDPIATAVALFKERLVRRAPVVDESGSLVGILSIADVVHASATGRIAKDVRGEVVFAAVHALSHPRKGEVASAKPVAKDVLVPKAAVKVAALGKASAAGKVVRKK